MQEIEETRIVELELACSSPMAPLLRHSHLQAKPHHFPQVNIPIPAQTQTLINNNNTNVTGPVNNIPTIPGHTPSPQLPHIPTALPPPAAITPPPLQTIHSPILPAPVPNQAVPANSTKTSPNHPHQDHHPTSPPPPLIPYPKSTPTKNQPPNSNSKNPNSN
ncbi:hypothetical protein D9756_008516 [Leucocoprinus leucothites]|uniref:Uncharacterized protein n=1 Tax=Leucocoprinus leucothites TaxID=201217 RepID=A0A8H5CZR1_9AGAR|nr:hypothetical protein D9756_008516 [Leucoagaricus leucothites]